ncbi:hypothetical protein EPIR_0548 [Erwinia piriflorinigrans CFBP 5888]|uniref:Uncharacterized protein n=1 Tax=Erwinia piriflorinigrans CFBP 5888 TaxID=1161919 RepID=V5Z4M6_9GAMM|nr:hypothetical protein EPIR_0548 [Erwinia piriflorinigrans CFBP 5888]
MAGRFDRFPDNISFYLFFAAQLLGDHPAGGHVQ